MENLHLKVEGAAETFTLLQGKALEQKAPVKIVYSGDIKTVANFLNVRKTAGTGLQTIDISKAVLLVDKRDDRSIQLNLDPENAYGAEITARLEESDELQPFSINKNKTFTKEELVKLLKFSRLYFADADKHAAMLLAFQKVSSTVNIRANDSSDERGNKERNFVKEVTTNAPTEFILNIPIWKGFPAITFRVEVCLDVTEGSARFWFESVELHEIKQAQLDDIFNQELKSAEGFVIINK
jgi:hypothetical protein